MSVKKKVKRYASMAISLSLVASALVACSSESSTNTTNKTNTTNTVNSNSTEGGASTSDRITELTQLSLWIDLIPDAAAIMKSYDEVTAWQVIEEKTGVDIQFEHPAQGQLAEQFNLMVAANKLPDVVFHTWNSYPGGAMKAISDKKIVALNDYLDYAPNLKKILDENPEWRKMASTDNGEIIGFPFLREDVKQQVFLGPAIRQDWLDKLGLSVPTTIDEWYNVLKAFKEQDPNGNGQADEIPITLSAGELAFAGAFGTPNDFYQENGTVAYGPIQPNFKEYLATMNQWYNEGLLDQDFASNDGKMIDAKMTGDQLGSMVAFLAGGIGKYMDLMAGTEFKLVGAPYPTMNAGEQPVFGHIENAVTGIYAAITGSSKDVVETVKFLDYLYSEEGKIIMNFGREGESFNFENGEPVYTEQVLKNPDGLPISQSFRKHIMGATSGPFVQDVRHTLQYLTKPEQKIAMENWAGPTHTKRMPPVSIAVEDSSQYASIMTDVNTYKDEMILKFIMNAEPLENFDKYVETLKSLGIEKAIEIQQAAIDRYGNR